MQRWNKITVYCGERGRTAVMHDASIQQQAESTLKRRSWSARAGVIIHKIVLCCSLGHWANASRRQQPALNLQPNNQKSHRPLINGDIASRPTYGPEVRNQTNQPSYPEPCGPPALTPSLWLPAGITKTSRRKQEHPHTCRQDFSLRPRSHRRDRHGLFLPRTVLLF